jgi:hypothetical protein
MIVFLVLALAGLALFIIWTRHRKCRHARRISLDSPHFDGEVSGQLTEKDEAHSFIVNPFDGDQSSFRLSENNRSHYHTRSSASLLPNPFPADTSLDRQLSTRSEATVVSPYVPRENFNRKGS